MMKWPLFAAPILLLGQNVTKAEDLSGADKERWIWFPPGAMTFKQTGKQTGGSTCWALWAIGPKTGTIFHQHTYEDETFYVLNGTFEIDVGGQITVGGPGTCVFGPRGTPHRFTNVGTEQGRLVTVWTPAGLENWFQALGVPIHEPGDRPQVDLAVLTPKIVAAARHYGLVPTGPPKYPHS